MRLRKGLNVENGAVILDSFTPTTQKYMQDKDYDLGSSSPCILPTIPESHTPHMIVQASKDFNLRLINRDNMSGQGCCGKTGGEVDMIPFEDGFVFNHPLAWQDPMSGTVWVYVTTTDAQASSSPTRTGFHACQVTTFWLLPVHGKRSSFPGGTHQTLGIGPKDWSNALVLRRHRQVALAISHH